MNKWILLTFLILCARSTQAQQLHKDLLIGKWKLYGIQTKLGYTGIDSAEQGFNAIFKKYKNGRPTREVSIRDSLEMRTFYFSHIKRIGESFITFNSDSTAIFFLIFQETNTEFKELTRTFEWTLGNYILFPANENPKARQMLFKVVSLTENELVVSEDSIETYEQKSSTRVMSFRKNE